MKNKIKKFKLYLVAILLLTIAMSCEDGLEEKPIDQYAPSNVLTNKDGLEALLYSAYGYQQRKSGEFRNIQNNYLEEGTTDIFLQEGGGQGPAAAQLQNFTFGAEHNWIRDMYDESWDAIRDVNLFLANIDNAKTYPNRESRIGEAKFIRALQYHLLTKWFGEVPLITSSTPELYPIKAPLKELQKFIEDELIAAIALLPAEQPDFYRITKGAALGILTKQSLNTKQWQKAANTAQTIIDLNKYELYPDYISLFAADNDRNNEYIFATALERLVTGNTWMALSLPPSYPHPGPNFAAQFKYYDAFVNSFDINDKRREFFLTEYTKTNGQFVQLLGKDDTRSLKYWDADRVGALQENDWPIVRYADILLSRAEALNELNGPTQEAIDLINSVRDRAGVNDILFASFSKESLRDHILKERGWEFYSEAQRRSDLIRHGKFIESALARGKAAKPYHVLYPIPQTEINANPNLEQNDGY
jgi:hypothetical protein